MNTTSISLQRLQPCRRSIVIMKTNLPRRDSAMTHCRGRRARRFSCSTLGLVLSLVAGCAAAPQLAWQRVDDVIVDQADEWLDLEPRQEQHLRQRLLPWLEEVRHQRLEEYADFLRALADRLDEDIDLEDARWANERFDALYEETMSSFLPVITPALTDLSPAQQRHLAERIQERNREYRDDYVDGRDGGRYAIAERIIEAVERWTSTLYTRQRKLIHTHVRELPRTTPDWYRYRRDMQQRLLQQIEDGASDAEIEHTLRRWWVERGKDDMPESTPIETLRTGLHRTLVELGHSLSAEQRAEARRRLRARADNLLTIAAGAD